MNRSRYATAPALNNATFRELVAITAVPFPLEEFCEAWALQRGLPHPSDCTDMIPVRPAPCALMPRTRKVPADLRARLALAFHDAAQRPSCSICHEPTTGRLEAHHWVEHGVLRREFRNLVDPLRLEAIAYDVRNAGGICDRCHGGHHGPSVRSRITRQHVPESAWEFACEIDALALRLDPTGGTERFTVRLEGYRA